jgi:hypothetical protein
VYLAHLRMRLAKVAKETLWCMKIR